MSAVMRSSVCVGGLHTVNHRVELVPVGRARSLEVIDLGRQTRLSGNRDELVDGLEQLIPLAAHVRDVHATVLASDLGDLDQLVGLCVERGSVDQRRTDPERALFHALPHERSHGLQLGLVGSAIVIPEFVHT